MGPQKTDSGVFIIISVTDILKKFNPDLRGYAVGEGDEFDDNSWLNVAVMGARAVWDIFLSMNHTSI